PADQTQEILLQAAPRADIRTLYWYYDDEFVAEAAPDSQVFIPAETGQHRIRVLDDRGRSSGLKIEVKTY
ncbi:MAG: hypothetical protein AAFV07_21545, partial [Bacteroidota bacterium]